MKTNELTGAALDWAVAKCEAQDLTQAHNWVEITKHYGYLQKKKGGHYSPSTNWAQGGPIIEREDMCVQRDVRFTEPIWVASIPFNMALSGPTPLIAAMRCYVASKLGDDVDVPKEML